MTRKAAVGVVAAGAFLMAGVFLFPRFKDTLAALLSIAVGISTIVYALLTARLVETQTRPHVVVYMELHGFLIYLTVKNLGAGEARELRFGHVGSFDDFPDQQINAARFLTDGIQQLAPGQKVQALLANGAGAVKTDKWPSVVVSVTYMSVENRSYSGKFPLHLSDFRGSSMTDLSLPPERIAESLKKISDWTDRQR